MTEQHQSYTNTTKEIPLNQILYGPPGTGKTYHTIHKALEICGIVRTENRRQAKRLFDRLVRNGQVVWTTFHQSMSYEDFVEGIKPTLKVTEGSMEEKVVYELEEGIFKRICRVAQERREEHNFDAAYASLLEEMQVMEEEFLPLTSRKGTNFWVSLNGRRNLTLSTKTAANKLATITKERIYKQLVEGQASPYHTGYVEGVANYLREQHGYREGYKPFILIIDEINRANVSQVFGELITLIEPDKRLGNVEALQVTLPYSKTTFGVPNNLYIIGTMNTADRSVEALDTALRRRFSFIELPPQPHLLKTVGALPDGLLDDLDLSLLLTRINIRIEQLLDRDHLIGHSYFLRVKDWSDLQKVFYQNLIPLLQEYFFGDYGKIGLVLGIGFVYAKPPNLNVFADFDYETMGMEEVRLYEIVDYRKDGDLEGFKEAVGLVIED